MIRRKYLLGAALAVVLFLLSFTVVAYNTGKEVTNEPYISWVSHTEYWRDDSGSTIVRLSDYRGAPYTVDGCSVTILYPNKTVFVDNQAMQETPGIPGNWYRTDSLAGAPLGTYEQLVTCTKGGSEIKSSQSFHLNPALEQISVLTEKADNLDTNLANVSVTIQGQIADTNQAINTNINLLNTNVETLFSDLDTAMTSQFEATNTSMDTQFSDLNVSMIATVLATGEQINTNIDDVNASLTELINTSVVNNLTAQLDAILSDITNQISDLNISITGTVVGTGQEINTNISGMNTDITNLLSDLDDSMTSQFTSTNTSMDTQFSNLDISLTGTMTSTGDTIRTDISDVNASLAALINQAIVGDMSTQIAAALADITQQISDLNVSIQAKVAGTETVITTQVTDVNTSLSALMASVKNEIQSDLSAHDASMSSQLSDVNISVVGTMTATGAQLSTQISDVNESLASMLNNIVVGDLSAQMDTVLANLTAQLDSIKSDTNWLVSNAMNQDDMTEIRGRFDTVDSSLSTVEQFCSNGDTNSSALCQEIYNIRSAIQVMEAEQNASLDEINTTTTNTWLLLSGDISTNIDTLLTDIGIIKSQTTDINSTTHEILDEIQSEVRVSIIS